VARAHGLTSSASLESLRGHFLQEARERAAVEGERLLQMKLAEATRMAADVVEAAEVEAEAMRLKKRSQSQADAEAEVQRKCEIKQRREVARITREYKAAIQQLHAQHAASVAALASAVASLGPEHAGDVAQLHALSAAVGGLREPTSPSTSHAASSSDGGGADGVRADGVRADGVPSRPTMPPPLPSLISWPTAEAATSPSAAGDDDGSTWGSPSPRPSPRGAGSAASPRGQPTPLQRMAIDSLREALSAMGASMETASVGVQTGDPDDDADDPDQAGPSTDTAAPSAADGELRVPEGVQPASSSSPHGLSGSDAGDGSPPAAGSRRRMRLSSGEASHTGEEGSSDGGVDGQPAAANPRMSGHRGRQSSTEDAGADDEASASASDRRGYDSSTSSASDRPATGAPPPSASADAAVGGDGDSLSPPAVLTMQAGNVRITYNAQRSSAAGVGVCVSDATGVPAPRRGGGSGLAERHRQRREMLKAARRMPQGSGRCEPSVAAMSTPGADSCGNDCSSVGGQATVAPLERELSVAGVHVLRAPGCILRIHS
jgi:hypothetical protein